MSLLPFPTSRSSPIHALLDVGSNKIMCLIVRLHVPTIESRKKLLAGRRHHVEVLGVGLQRSQGIKSGVVVDINDAEKAMRRAVVMAERNASMHIEGVRLSISSGRLSSRRQEAYMPIDGEVRHDDLRTVLKQACNSRDASDTSRVILHAITNDYLLDNKDKVDDPLGMVCETLGANVTLLSADRVPLDNIELCLNRSHLSLTGIVSSAYASGLSVLLDNESQLGTACIDMGAGTTTVSIFQEGHPIFADGIAIGSNHITMDLARCLSISVAEAENIKIKKGSVVPMDVDAGDMLDFSPLDSWGRVNTGQLSAIIRARVEETFELVRDRISHAGFGHILNERVVLTGGGCQLDGLCDLGTEVFGSRCRIGRPLGISGLQDAIRGPAFSAVCGLALYPDSSGLIKDDIFSTQFSRPFASSRGGLLSRMGHWIKESF